MPPTLGHTVLRQLGVLPASTIEVLELASVLARRFLLAHLSALVGRSPVELLADLEHSLNARLLGRTVSSHSATSGHVWANLDTERRQAEPELRRSTVF